MIKKEAEEKRLWWEFQKSKGSLSGGQRAKGGRPASKSWVSLTSELLSLPKEDVNWFLLEVRKKWQWVTWNFRKGKKNYSNSEGRSLTEFTYSPLNVNEMPCTKSTSSLQGHIVLACRTTWVARRGVLGTLVWALGPVLKAWIQQHIILPPEPPCVPKALRWHSQAPHCTNEAWQVWINLFRQTIPWLSLLALQVLPAIQPGKADICLVGSQLIPAQQDAKAA